MARNLNGTSDFINCGGASGSLDITGAITVSAWINCTSFPALGSDPIRTVVAKGFDGTNVQYFLGFDGSNFLPGDTPLTGKWFGFTTYNGVANQGSEFNHSLADGTWHQIAGAFDGTNIWTCYIDGVQVDTRTNATAPIHTAIELDIGQTNLNGTAARWFNGNIADVGIWNVQLSAGEIAALGNGFRPKDIRPASLQGYWPLDGLQSPEPDFSGKVHNGTLTGTSLASGPPVAMFTPRWPQFWFPSPPPAFVLMPQIVT
jgi:hypothetical protein